MHLVTKNVEEYELDTDKRTNESCKKNEVTKRMLKSRSSDRNKETRQ